MKDDNQAKKSTEVENIDSYTSESVASIFWKSEENVPVKTRQLPPETVSCGWDDLTWVLKAVSIQVSLPSC